MDLEKEGMQIEEMVDRILDQDHDPEHLEVGVEADQITVITVVVDTDILPIFVNKNP